MRLVGTAEAEEGAILARDVIVSPTGVIPLLRRGVALTGELRTALLRSGVTSFYVQDDISEGIEPRGPIPIELRVQTAQVVSNVLRETGGPRRNPAPIRAEHIEDLSLVSRLIAQEVQREEDVARVFGDLSHGGEYLLQHCVDVCSLGVMLAAHMMRTRGWVDERGVRSFSVNEARLTKLGVGLLLHDIGKLTLPPEILDKPGKLDAREWDVIRSHPALGEALLPGGISFAVRAIVRSHHEKWTGGGYPDDLRGSDIPPHARIAQVADVFDAITSHRAYKSAAPAHVGWTIISEGAAGEFDPGVVDVFREVVVPFPPGSGVVLPDGRPAVIADVDPGDPLLATVRVASASGAIEELRGVELTLPTSRAAAA